MKGRNVRKSIRNLSFEDLIHDSYLKQSCSQLDGWMVGPKKSYCFAIAFEETSVFFFFFFYYVIILIISKINFHHLLYLQIAI